MSGNRFDWDEDREQDIFRRRGFSFPNVVHAILGVGGRLMNVLEHSDQTRYPEQKYYQVEIESNDKKYICLVPFTEKPNGMIQLHTISSVMRPAI